MEPYPESRMKPTTDVNESLHHQVKLASTLAEIKTEPEKNEDIGTTPNFLYTSVDIKTEQLEENHPKLILPDWSYNNSESASETEDKTPVAMESEREYYITELVDRKNLFPDEASSVISDTTEGVFIKEEPEDDLCLSMNAEENEEMGRGKSPEVMSEVKTESPQAGNLFSYDQNEFIPRMQCGTELKRKKVEEIQCDIDPFHINHGFISQSVKLHDQETRQVQEKDETFKMHKQTEIKETNYQEFLPIHNTKQNVQTVNLKVNHYECQQCGKFFSGNGHMKRHVLTVHQKMKQYACQHCGQKFGQRCSMKQHVETVHLQKKLFVCQHCGQKFSRSCHMKQHVQTVHLKEKQFECQHCGHKFGEKRNLKQHVQTIHMKEKLFVCKHCGQKFGQSHNLKYHVKKLHLIETV